MFYIERFQVVIHTLLYKKNICELNSDEKRDHNFVWEVNINFLAKQKMSIENLCFFPHLKIL